MDMDQKKISGIVLALLVIVTIGTSASLAYESSQIELLTRSISAMSDRLDRLVEGQSDALAGRVLADSPDGKFVVRGTGACHGSWSVAEPQANDADGIFHVRYDLRRSEAGGSADADLGTVAIQTSAQFQSKPMGSPYAVAFRRGDDVAQVRLADATADGCRISVTER